MKTGTRLLMSAVLVLGLTGVSAAAAPEVTAEDRSSDKWAASLFTGAYILPGDEPEGIDNPGLGVGLDLQYRVLPWLAITGDFYYAANLTTGGGSHNWGVLPGVRVQFPMDDFEMFLNLSFGVGAYEEGEIDGWGSGTFVSSTRVAPTLGISAGIDYRLLSFMSVGIRFKHYITWIPESDDPDITISGNDTQAMYGAALTFHF